MRVRGSGARSPSDPRPELEEEASPPDAGGGSAFVSMPQRPAPRHVAIAMYGLMSAAVCRYSTRVQLAPPGITRTAHVRFSKPHDAVSGAHTPGT